MRQIGVLEFNYSWWLQFLLDSQTTAAPAGVVHAADICQEFSLGEGNIDMNLGGA